MAYRKKRFRKRRMVKKPEYTVGGSVAHLAKRAMQGVTLLKSMINVEYKYHDLGVILTNLDWSGVGGNFHAISQGTGVNQRTGDSIKVTSLDLGISIYKQSAQNTTIPYRLMIIRGKDENSVSPTGGLILPTTGTYQSVNMPRNVDNLGNYKIIYEKRGVISGTNDLNAVHHIEHYIPINDHIHYLAGQNTAQNGGLYYLFFCDSPSGSNVPQFSMYARTRFVDN